MIIYKLTIGCVDGESWYIYGSPDRLSVFTFLKQYDHEGSNVDLDIIEDGKETFHYSNDQAYIRLAHFEKTQ